MDKSDAELEGKFFYSFTIIWNERIEKSIKSSIISYKNKLEIEIENSRRDKSSWFLFFRCFKLLQSLLDYYSFANYFHPIRVLIIISIQSLHQMFVFETLSPPSNSRTERESKAKNFVGNNGKLQEKKYRQQKIRLKLKERIHKIHCSMVQIKVDLILSLERDNKIGEQNLGSIILWRQKLSRLCRQKCFFSWLLGR